MAKYDQHGDHVSFPGCPPPPSDGRTRSETMDQKLRRQSVEREAAALHLNQAREQPGGGTPRVAEPDILPAARAATPPQDQPSPWTNLWLEPMARWFQPMVSNQRPLEPLPAQDGAPAQELQHHRPSTAQYSATTGCYYGTAQQQHTQPQQPQQPQQRQQHRHSTAQYSATTGCYYGAAELCNSTAQQPQPQQQQQHHHHQRQHHQHQHHQHHQHHQRHQHQHHQHQHEAKPQPAEEEYEAWPSSHTA